ncbi:transglycosylase SLT domain-containing protein [Candidatus Gracilibacteria bacterium]|nr:transglycosylase SLT domain-containing protein [Candidatus Gracilibacteria bacterium]
MRIYYFYSENIENPKKIINNSEKQEKKEKSTEQSLDTIKENFSKNFKENPEKMWKIIEKNLPLPPSKAEKKLLDLKEKNPPATAKDILAALEKISQEKREILLKELTGEDTKLDKKEDGEKKEKSTEKESVEKITKTTTNAEFLNIPFNNRLPAITKPPIRTDEIEVETKIVLNFDYDGDGKQDKSDLYYKTTAGQILPDTVMAVKVNGDEYERKNLKGEFFDKNGRRLIIGHQTLLKVSKLWSKEELENKQKQNEKLVKEFEKKHEDASEYIIKQAIDRGIDPNFALLAFGKKYGKNLTKAQEIEIENAFTEFDRVSGKTGFSRDQKDGKHSAKLSFAVLKKFGESENAIETKLKDYGFSEEEIKGAREVNSTKLHINSLHKNLTKEARELLSDPKFMEKLSNVAKNIGASVQDLVTVMMSESGMNPQAINDKSNASGLIQFMPETAEGLGTSVSEIQQMSGLEQLDYVERYFKKNNRGHRLDSVEKLYLATFYPNALSKGDDYIIGFDSKKTEEVNIKNAEKIAKKNRGITKDVNGFITRKSFRKYVENKTQQFAGVLQAVKSGEYMLAEGSSTEKLQALNPETRKLIQSLSNNYNFKEKVIDFAYEVQSKGMDMKIIEAKRSFHRQQKLVAQGKSKTMRSKHLEGLAIDVSCPDIGNDLRKKPEIMQIAAKYGLWNGGEMWGWDYGHFQAYKTAVNKNDLARMERRGTLPQSV